MDETIGRSNSAEIEVLTIRLKEMQRELLSLPEGSEQEHLGEEIRNVRDKISSLHEADQGAEERLKELRVAYDFLEGESGKIEEYDDALVRRFVDSIVVYDYSITIRFKTGREISIRA